MTNEAEERARYIENLKSRGHRNIPINQDGFFLDMYQRFRWEGWQAARAASPVSALPIAFMCPEKCGCLWRDNHAGTMSLFGPSSKSCPKCESLPLDKLIPLFAVAPVSAELPIPPQADLAQQDSAPDSYPGGEGSSPSIGSNTSLVNAPPIVSVFTVQPPLAMGSDVCSRIAQEIHGEACTTIIPGGR